MAKYVHLQRVYSSSTDFVKRKVVIKGTRKSIGQGGHRCNVKYSSNRIKKGVMLSILKNNKNEEFVALEEIKGKSPRVISDEELKELKFKLTNFDF